MQVSPPIFVLEGGEEKTEKRISIYKSSNISKQQQNKEEGIFMWSVKNQPKSAPQ